jgi:hypothetical protein
MKGLLRHELSRGPSSGERKPQNVKNLCFEVICPRTPKEAAANGSQSIFKPASTAIDPACLKTGIQLSHYIDVSQGENTIYCDLICFFYMQ